VPINWTAYEEIANFFTNDVKNIDGVRVYGHMDYGKKDPSLGLAFTDAWLSMAGEADIGAPTACRSTNGASASPTTSARRSARRSAVVAAPTARRRVYALTKYIEWLHKYARPRRPA